MTVDGKVLYSVIKLLVEASISLIETSLYVCQEEVPVEDYR